MRTLEIVLFIANFQAFINTKVILLTKRWDQESYCEVPSYSLFSLCQILLWIKKFDNLSVSCLTRAERSRVSEWRQRSVTAAGNGRHTDAVVSSSQSTGRWTTGLAAGRCSDISSYIQVGGFLLFKCDSGATREIIKKTINGCFTLYKLHNAYFESTRWTTISLRCLKHISASKSVVFWERTRVVVTMPKCSRDKPNQIMFLLKDRRTRRLYKTVGTKLYKIHELQESQKYNRNKNSRK